MKFPTIALISLAIISPASAHGVHFDEVDRQKLEEVKEEFNSYDELPGFMGSLVGDQKITVHINNGTSQKEIGVKTEGTKISQTKMSGYENSTLEVWTNYTQIDTLLNSDEPVSKANTYLKKGKIEYQSKGVVNKARFFVAEKLLSLGSMF